MGQRGKGLSEGAVAEWQAQGQPEAELAFENVPDRLTIAFALEHDPSLPGYGDARLSVRVNSSRFAGHGTCWVEQSALKHFADAVGLIEGGGSEAAPVRAMSEQEFALVLRPMTSRGYFAVEGQVGHLVHKGGHGFWHSVTFGFAVEWAQVARAAQSLARLVACCPPRQETP